MAQNYQTYTSTIFINDDQAISKIDSLNKKIAQYKKDMETALQTGGVAGNKAWKEAEKNIRQAKSELKKLSTTSQNVNRVLGSLSTSSVKDIQATVRALNKELNSGSIPRNSEAWKVLTEQLRLAKQELRNIQDESKAATKLDGKGNILSKGITILNKNWGAITQVIGGITQLSMTIRSATQAYADMEESMANVRKYTGQTSEEVHAMNEEFKQMDTRTSREQLNELAGAAGRLGITSHDAIMEFVEAADTINVALGDDLGDGAVDKIGKLAMAFGEDDRLGLRGAMLSTGSAINELAQNSAANAGYLVEFAARLAGVGQQAGLTQSQILGFGAVLDENMQKDEMASTALSKVITALATDSSTIAQVAGLNVQEFARLVKEDMNSALVTLFEALNNKNGFTELAPMFEQMGLDGTRATAVLSVMAQKIEDVKEKQELATNAYKEANSVIEEQKVQNTTVQAEVDKAKKKFHDLAVELGQQLMPVVKYTVSSGSALIKILSVLITFTSKHTSAVAILAVTIGTYTVAMKLANAQSKLSIAYHTALATVTTACKIATNRLALSIVATTMKQKVLNATIRAFPGTWLATAIAALVTVCVAWQKRLADTDRYARELTQHTEELTKKAGDQKKKIQELLPVAQDETKSERERKQAIDELRSIMPEYFKDLDKESAKYYKVSDAIDAVNERLYLKLQRQAEAAKAEYEQAKADYEINNNGAVMPGATGTAWVNEGALSEIEALRKKAEAADKALNNLNKTLYENGGGFNFTKPNDIHNRKNNNAGGGNDSTPSTSGGTNATTTTAPEAIPEEELAKIAYQYSQQLITYDQFIEAKKELTRKYITDEKQQGEQIQKLSEQQIEQERVAKEALLKAQYIDPTSDIYQNETALNEAVFENDMDALAARITLQKEGSEEWVRLMAERDAKCAEHEVQQREDLLKQLDDMRKQYNELTEEEQMQAELDALDKINAQKLISMEEYEQAKLAIRNKYSKTDEPTTAEKGQSIVDNAKTDTQGGDDYGITAVSEIFSIVKARQQANEQLKLLYGEDAENNEEYNEQKKQNNQAMLDEIVAAASAAFAGINNIMSAASAYAQACSDLETAKITAEYDKQIEAAGNNTKKKEKLEKERDKKIAAAKTKANKKAMTIEIAQAVASTAMAAINAYASASKVNWILGPIAAAAATAAGMLQIATIKKQHEAEQAGYYVGGFTGGTDYRRQAGVVHEGEFVANHNAVNNAAILPALQLIDQAQRNNTVASLTADDVSQALGTQGGTAVVSPVVNVQTDNAELNKAIGDVATVVDSLNAILAQGINAKVGLDGPDGFDAQYRKYQRLKG